MGEIIIAQWLKMLLVFLLLFTLTCFHSLITVLLCKLFRPLCMLSLELRWQRICLQCRRCGFNPWVGKILWRREWQPTPVFLLGEFHGQRSLAGYSPWGLKESDMTERLMLSLSFFQSISHINLSKWVRKIPDTW